MKNILPFIIFLSFFAKANHPPCASFYQSTEEYVFTEVEKIETYYYEFLKKTKATYSNPIIQHSEGLKAYYIQTYENSLTSLLSEESILISTQEIQKNVSQAVIQNFFSISLGPTPKDPFLSEKPFQIHKNYSLERHRQGKNDFISKVRFETDFTKEFRANPSLKKRMIKALNLGKVTHNEGQSGIKKATKGNNFIYEVKSTGASDKRLWGCLDTQGILVIKGLATHSEIHKILQRFTCP